MTKIRKLAFVFLLVYLGFAVGASFHSHQSLQEAANCQLCQIAHAPQDVATGPEQILQSRDLGVVTPVVLLPAGGEFEIRLCGRAPPLS
jgi:hypothetical protein